MATFDQDSFTGTTGTLLTAHTPEAGGSWANALNSAVITAAGRARSNTTAEADVVCQGTPASADYDVQADLFIASATAAIGGVAGRADATMGTSGTTGNALEFYYDASGATKQYTIQQGIHNSWTTVGTSNVTLAASSTTTLKLQLRGTAVTAFAGGTQVITGATTIATAGKAGILMSSVTTASDTTDFHLDNFSASDPVTATFPPLPALWHNPLIPQ